MQKTAEQRLNDLREHATLLEEACTRFREQHKLNEVRNIATRLRVLLGEGKGNNLLFDLMPNLKILVLESHVEMIITEIESETQKIVRTVTKRKLRTKPIANQPTLPIITTNHEFLPWLKEVDFKNWIQQGFLMDWEIPNDQGTTPKITRLTPHKLIKAYADKEASHSDKDYCEKEFGAPFEKEEEIYNFNGKTMPIPVIYNYLYQIGQVTAKLVLVT